jgi:Tfp pilus assembly protein PilF
MIRRRPERAPPPPPRREPAGRPAPPAHPGPAGRPRVVLTVLILAGLALGVAAVIVFARREPADRGERREALRLARAGQYGQAEPLLLRALAQDANDAEVVAALATGKLWANDVAAAEQYLARWSKLSPQDAQPLRLRMNMRHRLGFAEREKAARLRLLGLAADDGRRVLELEPGNEEVRRDLAWLLVNVGRFAEAEQACRRGLAAAPGEPRLLLLLARACHAQGKRADAETALEPLVRDPAGSAEALILRATLYREAGRPEQALPLLRQALTRERGPRRDYLYELGLALAAAGQAEEAGRVLAEVELMTLQEAVTRDRFPNTPALRVQTAEARLAAGQAEEARAALEQVLAESPDFAPAHRVLARYYEQKGQADKAAEHRRRADQK